MGECGFQRSGRADKPSSQASFGSRDKPPVGSGRATERRPNAIERQGEISHDELDLEVQHAKAKRPNPRIPPIISAEPSRVIRPVDLDHEPAGGSEKVLVDGDRAYTDANLVTLDTTHWNTLAPERQLRLLAHETAHSVQFEKIGYLKTRFRTGLEALTKTHEELYDVPGELHRIKLGKLDVGDSRFTLEAIAEHIKHQVRVP